MLESVPCFFITLIAGMRIHRIYKSQSSRSQSGGYSRGTGMSKDNFSPAPIPRSFSMSSKGDMPLSPLPSSPPPAAQSPESTRHAYHKSVSVSQHSRGMSSFSFRSEQPLKSPITPISTVVSPGSDYDRLEERWEKELDASGALENRPWGGLQDSERTSVRWDSKCSTFEDELS